MAADFWESVAGGDGGDGAYVAPGSASPRPAAVPTRKTAQGDVDAWNAQMRQSPVYLNFMRRNGLSTDGRVKLSKSQQSSLERELAQAGMPVPGGMHIDQGGNLNQKNTLVRNVAIGAAATGAALTGFGMAGMGPMSGLFGGSTLASSSLPVASLMGGAPAAASGVPLASLAGGASALGGSGAALSNPAIYGGLFGGAGGAAPAAAGGLFAPAGGLVGTSAATGALGGAPAAAGGGGVMNSLAGLFRKPGVMPQIAAGGFNLLQAKIAADSARSAAATQAQYGNRALDFEMGRYNDAKTNFTPFLQGGQTAFASLSDILKTPRSYTSDLERLARGGRQ